MLVLLLTVASTDVAAQMTRGQLLRKYYQITQLHNSGKDAEAIALCEEITSMYPKLPDTYLRMAEIYYEGGEQEMALVMYRTYTSLEMDDKKAAQVGPRMKELEEKLGAKSFEQQEEEEFQKLMAETAAKEQQEEQAAPAFTTSATSLFDISALVASANTKEPEPEPYEEEENAPDAAPEPTGGEETSLFDISAVDFSKPSQPTAMVQPEPEPEPEPEPKEPEPEISQEIQNEAANLIDQASATEVKPDCATPYLFSPHPTVVDDLHLKRDAQ